MVRLRPTVAGLRRGRRELAQKKPGNKIIELFRVFRGQKRFIYPRNTLKDAKFQRRRSAGSCSLDTIKRLTQTPLQHRLGVRSGGRSNSAAYIPPLLVRRLKHPCNPCYPWLLGPLRGGEADDLLFDPDGERAFCRRQESFFDILLGAGNKIAAATQVELALNIFAMTLNRFNAETERMSDLAIAEP